MCRILLIDDNPVQLKIREKLLRDADFRVSIATNAESAMALLRTEPLASTIAAIVTDHILETNTGADIARQVREQKSNVPIIVVSGMPGAESEYAGLNVIFRQKPCPPKELIDLLRSVSHPAA